MNCLDFQAWLQERLDGAIGACPADGARHVTTCVECRERFDAVQRLERGLQALAKVEPAPLLTQSILTAVVEDHNRRARLARRVTVSLSLAASILLALIAGWFWLPNLFNPAPLVVENHPVQPAAPTPETPQLERSAEQARAAVASLTERVADQTKGQAKLLLAMANTLDLPPMASLPDLKGLEEPLDPAAQSLRQASSSVASGIEPITRSARRALDFFARDMPMFEIPQKN